LPRPQKLTPLQPIAVGYAGFLRLRFFVVADKFFWVKKKYLQGTGINEFLVDTGQ